MAKIKCKQKYIELYKKCDKIELKHDVHHKNMGREIYKNKEAGLDGR